MITSYQFLNAWVKAHVKSERGASLVEYALLVALIAVVYVIAIAVACWVFEHFGGRVKYWLTFNEINSVIHEPFMSGGIPTPKDQLTKQDLYQAIHHELVASARATKLARELMPGAQLPSVRGLAQYSCCAFSGNSDTNRVSGSNPFSRRS